MVIKKHKPSLDGVLTRRRLSVGQYFADLGVTTHNQLVTVLEALIGTYRVSESLQEEAFAWVATLRKPEVIPQKEEEKTEPQAAEPQEEKPKKTSRSSKRSTKRSSTKRKTTSKKRSTKTSSDEEE